MTRDELQRRLDDLQRERDAVFDRVTWWENHRTGALVPLAAVSFAMGYGLGYGAHLLFSVPYQLGYLSGVAAMFLSGRVVERYTNPALLPLLDQRVAIAQKALTAASRGTS